MDDLDNKWESGELGRDEKYVKRSDRTKESLDSLLGLQPISIRLPKALLQDLKDIAQINGMGYQPLIKQILNRFVEGEKKIMAREKMNEELDKLNNQIKAA